MPPFDLASYRTLRGRGTVGANVHFRERTASTMDDARDAAGRPGREACGDAYVAGQQSAGRGRAGRSWVSAAVVGLYVTYHLCPSDVAHAPLLSIAGALAASDAILETAGLATQLKWPNDVLVDGRKLCGVLAESRASDRDEPARLDVFLGIGLNVRAPASLPPEIASIATSIEAAGAPPPSIEALLAALSRALERWADTCDVDPGAVIAAWRVRLATLGQRVRLQTPRGVVEGEAVAVSERGELVLLLDDGTRQPFSAGDVTTLRE